MSVNSASTSSVYTNSYPDAQPDAGVRPAPHSGAFLPYRPKPYRDSQKPKHKGYNDSESDGSGGTTKESDSQDQTNLNRPEIFRLLSHHWPGELLFAQLGQNSREVTQIVKEARQSRGVSETLPVSTRKREENTSVNHEQNVYLSTASFFKIQTCPGYTGEL